MDNDLKKMACSCPGHNGRLLANIAKIIVRTTIIMLIRRTAIILFTGTERISSGTLIPYCVRVFVVAVAGLVFFLLIFIIDRHVRD